MFHDAGRLDIVDHENILKAIEIFHNTMHFPASLEQKVNKYIAATEYNKETTKRLQKEGTIEELILRDSDFLVWATNNKRQEEMFQELSLEDDKNITKASTIRFLRKTGVFLPESKIMLEEAGFTKIPIKKSNTLQELLDKKDNNE